MDYLTLVGDSSDNIRGAKGIGPKTAVGLLNIFDSVDGVYRAIDVGDASVLKPAQRASLEELRPRLEGVRELLRMRTDVPLDVNEVFKRRVPTAAGDFMEGEAQMGMETASDTPPEKQIPVSDDPPSDQPATPVETAEAVLVVPEWERALEPRSMGRRVQAGPALAR